MFSARGGGVTWALNGKSPGEMDRGKDRGVLNSRRKDGTKSGVRVRPRGEGERIRDGRRVLHVYGGESNTGDGLGRKSAIPSASKG